MNILFECTNDINTKVVADFKYSKKIGRRVTAKYLQDVYSFARNVFDTCLEQNVKRLNIYIAAKQPINFVVGTAIRSYHPTIYVYEFLEGKYTTHLIIQQGKMGK